MKRADGLALPTNFNRLVLLMTLAEGWFDFFELLSGEHLVIQKVIAATLMYRGDEIPLKKGRNDEMIFMPDLIG